jgi:ATP-binding cassette, subfamily B, bacterial
LRGLNLRIHAGDRILLEDPSGGDKSTLAMLLAASRSPDSRLILLCGLDLKTLGAEAWRRRVLVVPQFHENHVFMGSFAALDSHTLRQALACVLDRGQTLIVIAHP